MTTDRGPKRCCVRAGGVTLSAQAKGAGMIEPGFATMLCFVQTDAVVEDAAGALRAAVDASFERITVDGQMSTNDTVLLQASGAAGRAAAGRPARRGAAPARARGRRRRRGRDARRPGRGAGRRHGGARRSGSPARSPTRRWSRRRSSAAIPNWGRIAQAAGMALAGEELARARPRPTSRRPRSAPTPPEAEISVDLGRGEAAAHVYFSDLGHRYVELNAEYTT